jgi:cell wall-associated NlpC family hydrolase
MKYSACIILIFSTCLFFTACFQEPATTEEEHGPETVADASATDTMKTDTVYTVPTFNPGDFAVDTKGQSPGAILEFAKTLIGVPYKYGSTDPAQGFDCSGFITYVFNHFGISVPRSSIDFTNVGTEVALTTAAPGDLILFTGTDSTERFVGHMGIVAENSDSLRFIHSTSGKKYGVTITTLNEYYKKRFVKITRIFNEGI